MSEITKYTDYAAKSPDFFIDFIKNEIVERDIKGLTNNRITRANITGEHPLVRMTETVLSGSQLDVSGFLPAIAVVEADENEEFTTIGQGKRIPLVLDQEFINNCRALPIEERHYEGLISDNQLNMIEQAIINNASVSPTGEGAVLAELEGFFLRETIFVSVWCHHVDERSIIGDIVRSILYDMRKAMIERKLKDILMRTAKGLVNTNFGRILHGQETSIDFINFFHNVTVTNEFPTKTLFENCEKISIYDAIQQSTEELCTMIDVGTKFRAVSHPEDNYINTYEGEIYEEG